jgi:hypothetical protein
MVFVAFLVPLGLYLVVLGLLNRRGYPMLVSGPMDLIGLLFGVSGFLVVGGPAIITALHESWRMWWVVGDAEAARESLDAALPWWLLVSGGYFVFVVGGCALLFRQYRALTSIYSVKPDVVPEAIMSACRGTGVLPTLSGNRFTFWAGGDGATLDLEPFDALSNVTLRWSPADTPIRPVIEAELARELEDSEPPEHDAGLWLCCAGLVVMGLAVVILFALVLYSWYR